MRVTKKLKWYFGHYSRIRKLEHFYQLCAGGMILDAGVTGSAHTPTANIFLETFRFADCQYTGLGIDDLSKVKQRHPAKSFVEYDGVTFPFPDKTFDWVFSNAVIEHVGTRQAQLHFLNEMLRVGRNVFFTTPNKHFPVESHTNAILLHWLSDRMFFDWCAKQGLDWNPANLNLLARGDIDALLQRSKAVQKRIFSNRTVGWPMTYTVICSDSALPTETRPDEASMVSSFETCPKPDKRPVAH